MALRREVSGRPSAVPPPPGAGFPPTAYQEPAATGLSALLFPWSDDYCVGVLIVDTQHQGLVDIINELHHAMIVGEGKHALGGIISRLIKYTQVHFKTEEDYMQAYGYPEYLSHKLEHDELTKQVLDLQGKFLRNEVGLTVEVLAFLKDWLTHHILGSDKKYGPFLNAKGVR
jgi:hemerythrin